MAKLLRRITRGNLPAQRKTSASFPLQAHDRETSLRFSNSHRLTEDADKVPVNPGSPSRSAERKSGGMRSARKSAATGGSLGSRPSDRETGDHGREDSECVGYGKPPRHSRFKPGQSGNPKGRTKNIKSFPNILKEELETLVEVTENGRRRKLSKGQLAIKGLVHKAVKGDHRAVAEILRQMEKHFQASNEKQQTSSGASDEQASAMSPMRNLILEYFAPQVVGARVGPEPSKSRPDEANQPRNHKGAKS